MFCTHSDRAGFDCKCWSLGMYALPGSDTCGNAAPSINDFTLVAMIVPTKMCRVLHPLICLSTPLRHIYTITHK